MSHKGCDPLPNLRTKEKIMSKHHSFNAEGTRLFNQASDVKSIAEGVLDEFQQGNCSFLMPTGISKEEALKQLRQIEAYLKKDL